MLGGVSAFCFFVSAFPLKGQFKEVFEARGKADGFFGGEAFEGQHDDGGRGAAEVKGQQFFVKLGDGRWKPQGCQLGLSCCFEFGDLLSPVER